MTGVRMITIFCIPFGTLKIIQTRNTEYVKTALQDTDVIELWHVWLTDYYEYEDSPVIHRKSIGIEELSVSHIKEIDEAVIWNTPDKMYPNRPSFYCLTIKK